MDELRQGRKRIFERIHGFYDVKLLACGIELGLFAHLVTSKHDVGALSQLCSASRRGVEALLIGAQALGLVRLVGAEYELTMLGRHLLDPESDAYMGDLVRFCEWQSDALPRLMSTLRTDAPCWEGFGHYIDGELPKSSDAKQERFNRALDAGARSTAKAVLRIHDVSRRKRLLDVGGSLGGFASVLLEQTPSLSATIFDLPQVAEQIPSLHREAPYATRLSASGGDFTTDPLPTGHDLITFIRIFNSRTDELCSKLLRKAYDALPPGGECLFYEEHVLTDDQSNVDPAMLWGAMFILISSHGSVRTVGHWKALFSEAGFVNVGGVVDKHYGIVFGTKK